MHFPYSQLKTIRRCTATNCINKTKNTSNTRVLPNVMFLISTVLAFTNCHRPDPSRRTEVDWGSYFLLLVPVTDPYMNACVDVHVQRKTAVFLSKYECSIFRTIVGGFQRLVSTENRRATSWKKKKHHHHRSSDFSFWKRKAKTFQLWRNKFAFIGQTKHGQTHT